MIILTMLLLLSLGVNFWLIVDTQVVKQDEIDQLKSKIKRCREAQSNKRLYTPLCAWMEERYQKIKKKRIKRLEKRMERMERLLDQKQVRGNGEKIDVLSHLKDRTHCTDPVDK